MKYPILMNLAVLSLILVMIILMKKTVMEKLKGGRQWRIGLIVRLRYLFSHLGWHLDAAGSSRRP